MRIKLTAMINIMRNDDGLTHCINPCLLMSKPVLVFILILLLNVLPNISYAQPAASWNYGTQTGTLGTTYSWIDCSDGTTIVSGDDTQASVSWPFSFVFYDNSYTTSNSISVATNGFIRLDGIAAGTDYNAATTYSLSKNATGLGQIIATSIYDCNVGGTSSSWVKYLVTGTAPNRIMTIEYNDIEIDYNDGLYADVQVSFYETLNKIVLKLGNDNIAVAGVDMGIHSGVKNFFNDWQEVQSGTNNTWIEYMPHIEVNATVGTSLSYYSTLKDAFDNINDGTHQGAITIKMNISTVETATATLNSSGSGSSNFTSVNIYPTETGISISGNLNAHLINFNGADNVTLDGRVNATGTTNDLVISNTRSSTSASTIRFILSAENNAVKYCNIEGSATSAGLGVIVFAGSTAGTGNNNNLIDNNNITSSASGRVYNAVYSAGTVGRENSGVIISNNNFFDFISPNLSSRGISIGSNSINWTVLGNSFYETTEIAPSGAYNYNMIYCGSSTVGHLISGNYIGGSAPQCGGAAFTVNSNNTHSFYAINIVGGTVSPVTVQNNTIKNFNYTSINTNPWDGIYLASNKIDVIGNSIGATTGTGSIVVTTPGTTSYSTTHAIRSVSTGVVTISSNSIGSITTIGSNTYSHCFEGIVVSGAAPSISITNNLIGSLTTASSIQTSSAAASSALKQDLRGIYLSSSVTVSTITGNTIANLTNAYTGGSFSKFDGICTSGGSNIIQNNTIRDFTTGSLAITPKGIQQTVVTAGTNQTVTGNTIYNLSNTHSSASVTVMGIDFSCATSGTNVVSENFIHSLNISSTNILSEINGIRLSGGVVTCANNIVNIGASLSLGYKLYGIFENGGASAVNVNNIYFNSIYISGAVSSGTTSSTAALWNSNNTNIRNIRNNIFMNARSGGATGKHYAIRLGGTSGLTIDYNDYYAPNGILGSLSGDRATLASWQTATGQDASSLNIDPIFNNAGGTVATDYYTSADLPGISGTGITTDYAGITRGSTPLMGALEINNYIWKGSISTDFATAGNWIGGVVPPEGADIYFDTNPDRSCLLDQNRTVKNITNSQAVDYFVVNGHQLTITGDLIFSNGAQINATSASSVIVFEGLAAQNIPSGALVSNTTDGLTINNATGLTLNGDLIISSNLSLAIGSLTIGANTLTLNGSITTTAGLLEGGSLTNIIIGGSGASTTLPAVTLNNLTLNRSNGIVLGGDVNLGGILNLTSGTLNLGSYVLTISGSSPLRTSGNIDASNASAAIVFNNSSAITLPASIFTGAINILTLSGSGGVTASSDFSIDGILNLQSANPSATKGILDIWDGSEAKTLTMGANATTMGEGDVTGIVARNYFTSGVQYSFGSQHTNISFIPGGTLPGLIKVKITIGTAPAWKPDAINRLYDFVQSGGLNCFATISSRYLDSELNGNDENYLTQWTFGANGQEPAGTYDWGFTNHDISENWVEIADVNIAYFPTAFGNLESTLATSVAEYVVWNGSVSTDWETPANWTPNTVPNTLTYVVIPDAETTLNDPLLPAIAEINNIWLQLGSVLNSNTNSVLTLTGNVTWINGGGTFVPSTGTVVLSNITSNVSGKTSFYNLTIPASTTTSLALASYIKIAGALTNNGILRTVIAGETTVEYNGLGDQTIIVPNSSTNRYYNLILSGSGTKTLPASSLDIVGSFSVLESAITSALESLNISDNFIVDAVASFTTGNFNHSVGGNFDCNGTFTASAGNTITLNGTVEQSVYGNTLTFGNLTINNSSGVSLYTDVTVNNALTLTSGTVSVGETTLTINISLVQTSGLLSVTDLSSLYFGGTSALTIPLSLFSTTPSINNLTINRTGGVTFSCDLTVNGILNLQSGNPLSTKGSLDMWDGTDLTILTMGVNATTIGIGDVTGIVKRTAFIANTPYTFGNQFTSITFVEVGTFPSQIQAKISIGTSPSWMTTAINRIYDFIQTGGIDCRAILEAHYLDNELNGNIENGLVLWGYGNTPPLIGLFEFGNSNSNSSDNWVSIANVPLSVFPSNFGEYQVSLANSAVASYTWNGSLSTFWGTTTNWTPNGIPSSIHKVIIPDASTTLFSPTLPASTEIKYLTLEVGGVLNAVSNEQLTVNGGNGAWNNDGGTFYPGTSNVIFTNAAATISGTTNFYDITIATGAQLTPASGNIMRIAGTLTNTGMLRGTLLPNTIEYNGTSQVVIIPNGATPGYYNLILSGSGTKTMPGTALSVAGDFSISGSATATASESLTILGTLAIENGATFATGSFDHTVGGNFENNGTFTISADETITLNGATVQNISGTSAISFENLIVDNVSGASLSRDISVNGALELTNGNLEVAANTLSINGSLTSTAGFIDFSNLSSLTFSGTSAVTIPNDIFTTIPIINNLTVNCSGGVTLGNQDLTIDGLLDLTSGTLIIGSNTLIIAGLSPVRTTGNLDASNATIQFTNPAAIILPASIFTGSVNNFTISGPGGVISNGDISLAGMLDLQSVNPSASTGSLDMSTHTFNMGELSHIIGVGDVTGIVKREHAFINNQEYCFGNAHTRLIFLGVPGSTKPTWVSCKIEIGTAPEWRTLNVKRIYSFLQSGGDDRTYMRLHYLDSELDALETDESKIIMYTDKDGLSTGDNTVSLGKTSNNITDNWVELVGMAINQIATSSTTFAKEYGLGYTSVSKITWTGAGSVSYPGDWSLPGNWLGGVPLATDDVLIPAGLLTTYPYRNLLPGTSPAVVKTLEIESGASLTMNSFNITIYGATNAWINNGTFTPGTGTVYFANGSTSNIATIAGTTNFYNLRVETDTYIQPVSGSIIRVESEIIFDATSILDFASNANTIDYNGADQTIINPNGSTLGYYNLTLSGSGNKTLPGSAMDIAGDLIITGTASATTIDNLYVNGNLAIASGCNFSVAPTSIFIVLGTITNSAGNSGFILKSDATGTASLIHNTNYVPATVQRYISGDAEAWHLISSPVSDQNIDENQGLATSWLPSGTYGNGTGYDLYLWNEPNNCWIYKLNTTTLVDWSTVHPGVNFETGRGYLYSLQALNPTKTFAGNLNNGTVTYSLEFSSTDAALKGFNLAGNPYPSSIDWLAPSGWSRSSLVESGGGYDMWIWNQTALNYGICNSFSGEFTNDVTGNISPAQGYFVRALATGSLICDNDVRIHNTGGTWLKKGSGSDNVVVGITVNSLSGAGSDEAKLVFGYKSDEPASLKLFSPVVSAPSLYLPSQGNNNSIRYLTDTIDNPSVPLMFNPGSEGGFIINCDFDRYNFETVLLEDKFTHQLLDLKASGSYSFKSSVGDNANRFVLHFSPVRNISENTTLQAEVYIESDKLIVDISGVKKETDLLIYNTMGLLLHKQKLQAETRHSVNLNSSSTMLIVLLKNQDGAFYKKLVWIAK